MIKFSVIIPTYNRAKTLHRALLSLSNQTYDKSLFEIIVVDDGSTDETEAYLQEAIKIAPNLEVITHQKNRGRIAARNTGMGVAKGEWICWLDSDDEYVSTYLEVCANAITSLPMVEIFNFGAVVYDEPAFHSSLRDTFLPELSPNGRGHVSFKSGRIGTGSFIFKKALLAEPTIGLLPEAATPYGLDDSFPARATTKWPGLGELYGRNTDGQWKPFGNPWGDDYVMFFALTRNHISVPLNIHPYIQHVRH